MRWRQEIHFDVIIYEPLKSYPARLDAKAISDLFCYNDLAFWSY